MSRKQMNKERKKKKSHKVLKTLLIILIVILVAIGGFVSYSTYKNGWGWEGLLATMMGHDQETVKEMDEFRILLMGVSSDIEAQLTDTIIVASYNPKDQKAVLLSIPRDTYVGTNRASANSYDKINALYQQGPEATLEAVNDITGLGIEYYAVIDTKALREVVDEIGGVEFDVPIDMKYTDKKQNLYIDLKAGVQKLDGDKAEQLLRFRHNSNGTSYSTEYGDNDIGRMRTQRDFLVAVAEQTLQLKNVTKIGELLDIVYDNLETNVKLSNVKDYLPYAIEFDTNNIKTGVLPGTTSMINKLSFYEHSESQTEELMKELFEINEDVTTEDEDLGINETTTTVTTTQAAKVKIELLNGSGSYNNVANVRDVLKRKGYNVYKTGTTTTTTATTIINNTNLDSEITTNIQELLGTGTISSTAIKSNSSANITIIIGKDYK